MNYIKRLVTKNAGAVSQSRGAAAPSPSPVPIYYSLSSFRWHMDTRLPVKAILLHDAYSSSHAWKQSLHECVSGMPIQRLSPTEPLEVYCPDLRGHGHSDALAVDVQTYVSSAVEDIEALQRNVLGEPCFLGGVGLGALVAYQAALSNPSLYSSLCLMVRDTSSIRQYNPYDHPYRNMLTSLHKKHSNYDDLNRQISSAVARPDERACLLLNTEQDSKDKTIRFRIDDTLLNTTAPLHVSSGDVGKTCSMPTTVFHVAPVRESDRNMLQKSFNKIVFSQLKEDEVLYPGSAKLAPVILHAFGLLGRMNDE